MREWTLGVGASHNGGACLIADGELVVAIQEERLTRVKRGRLRPAFDTLAIRYCLDWAGIDIVDLSLVGISRDEPIAMPESDLGRNPLFEGRRLPPIAYISHHRAHAAAAWFQSGFSEAAVLVIDGLGSPTEDCEPAERAAAARDGWETLSIYRAGSGRLTCLHKDVAPDRSWLSISERGMARFAGIGGMYSAAARLVFGQYLEAGKLMGLAPYGRPIFAPDRFFGIDADGGLAFRDEIPALFGEDALWPEREDEYADLAASVQAALERAVLCTVRRTRALTGLRHLAYAGGVALNCLANERILREGGFDDVFVMPAAEDSGTSIGAAVAGLLDDNRPPAPRRIIRDSTGRRYRRDEVALALDAFIPSNPVRPATPQAIASTLASGALVGWFAGGSELGPRALGHRSILADPRRAHTWPDLNRRKGRESFRPLAPVVLAEHADEWFEMGGRPESPFMLRVCAVREHRRDQIPAVVHVDATARVQTLAREQNPELYEVLVAFHGETGVPVLVNTSLNAAGEPIVETPEDALWCAARLGLGSLVLEDRLVTLSHTAEQASVLAADFRLRRSVGSPAWGGEVEAATPWGLARYWLEGRALTLLHELTGGAVPISELTGDEDRDVVEELRRKRLVRIVPHARELTMPDGGASLPAASASQRASGRSSTMAPNGSSRSASCSR